MIKETFVLENPKPRGKHYVRPNGYAAPPGSGPSDMKCRNCQSYFLHRMAKTYPKCLLNEKNWTGGRKSDILANSPACRLFEARNK